MIFSRKKTKYMKHLINSSFTFALPILVFLILSATIWQKVDDYNSKIEKKFYRLELEANGEQISSGGCGFGLVQVNTNIQNATILLLTFAFFSLLFKKSCSKFSQYFPILFSTFIVFLFNILLQFFRFDFYDVLNSKELGFYARYTTLPDLLLSLFYSLLVFTLVLHFCGFVKNKFQAKISLK